MKYRQLGNTGIRVSLSSFGTGGARQLGQNAGLTAGEQDALIRGAIDAGVNLFDSSAAYGNSEEILGRALTGVPRDSYVIATKWPQEDFAPDGFELPQELGNLTEGVDSALRRLKTDYIDVMQFHGLHVSYYDELVGRYAPVMAELKQSGKVRHWGFSEWAIRDAWHEAVIHALTNHPDLWEVVMMKHNLLSQSGTREALPLAEKTGTGVIVMAAVRTHISNEERLRELFAGWKRDGVIPADSVPDDGPLDWLVHDDVDSIASAAYKFAASNRAVSTVLSGTSNLAHLKSNIAALEGPPLPKADTDRLVGLLGSIEAAVAE
jgi:aryl-alcohol dehydrogenase-like predicted oxidoreductase